MTGAPSLAERLAREGLVWSEWRNGPGEVYAAHSHDYDKVLVATAGSIMFHLVEERRDVELHAGERLELPAGTTHAATVGGAGVVCLEAHLPKGSLGDEPRHRGPDW